ncbi:sugar 3,4-ketoisomerase [Mucilaginibacter sp. SP1R1]|uniref:sugar 3,4-ketoisomerase n=1 Tax=Mucilaginibacter sp. SP1R1 TaxID=2723091 RepID=UPI0016084281|nr:FdtA/QdtA family cupin domain-containing protein [Mucilaginibacter sp. SP1R1]MBB6149553.1 dTDP-4-dehydrorhamnose 3,5-epimerase-like enzyme [Mucilaginibacter sp. SP1R1]
MSLSQVKLINLPKILDERGNLSFLEQNNHIPFSIRRAYWIYDVPGGEARGGHSYKKNQELIIALSGSFDLIIKDKNDSTLTYTLNRSYYGLYIPSGIWRHMENFSTNSLAFVLASTDYDENDYERDYNQFLLGDN